MVVMFMDTASNSEKYINLKHFYNTLKNVVETAIDEEQLFPNARPINHSSLKRKGSETYALDCKREKDHRLWEDLNDSDFEVQVFRADNIDEGIDPHNCGNVFRLDDVEGLERFYTTRFEELGVSPLRYIVQAWIKYMETLTEWKPYRAYKNKRRPS
ncbi:hypothetical protein N0V90_013153 [Kalmusia sp. IMI 367209]|nr:hypothetical protein N0V90_013153 [Kalmusia sp. IMI 367209]